MKNNNMLILNTLKNQLELLKLPFILENFEEITNNSASKSNSHLEFLAKLIEGEAIFKQKRSTDRKIKQAKFPIFKTLDEYDFTFPKKVNEAQIRHFFHLNFISKKKI